PRFGHRPRRRETSEPHVAPPLADDRGVGRPRRIAHLRHDRAQSRRREAAAGIAERIAVVDAGGADDGLECGRTALRRLHRDCRAPGEAEHSDLAAAPGLPREPGDRLDGVVDVLRRELIAVDTLGIADAAYVEPDARVTVAR